MTTSLIYDIPSGERFQMMADYYIGLDEDFFGYNPVIKEQKNRHININSINYNWENSQILFCYGHRINDFAKKLKFLKNKCVIIFGNSDENQTLEKCQPYIDCQKVSHIFCQNLMFHHYKVSFIPIGLANSHWDHGNIQYFLNIKEIIKTKEILCSFKVHTNPTLRTKCLQYVEEIGIENRHFENQQDYLNELASSKFCISPEGNGIDCHRFWECIWLKTIPIVIRNPLVEKISKMGIPCIILDDWSELKTYKFDYLYFDYIKCDYYFDKITFKYYSECIRNKIELLKNDSMNVVLSFIGKMPEYIIECVKQLRLFFKDSIYIIYDDVSNEIHKNLDNYNVIWVEYMYVKSMRFDLISESKKFMYVENLQDREELFLRSYERFYLLDELIRLYNLKNVWFMEIDVLMYVNPNIFLPTLKLKPYCYFNHDDKRCNTAIFYVRDNKSLENILNLMDVFSGKNSFMSEMYCFKHYLNNNPDDMLFPLTYPSSKYNYHFWKNYGMFNEYIFDGAFIGQYLFGVHTHHTHKNIETQNIENIISINRDMTGYLQCWDLKYEWHKENNLLIPYINKNGLLTPIANLHIHSKDLKSAVSYR